ncbi:hypothetical protein BH10PSE16_BH10PSE16_34390 [soil metagenome]
MHHRSHTTEAGDIFLQSGLRRANILISQAAPRFHDVTIPDE